MESAEIKTIHFISSTFTRSSNLLANTFKPFTEHQYDNPVRKSAIFRPIKTQKIDQVRLMSVLL